MDYQVLFRLFVVVTVTVGTVIWIWRATNPDPVSGRVNVSAVEQQRAVGRLPWIEAELARFSTSAGIAKLRPPKFANFGAHYSPIQHRVCVSRAMCARLSDTDLQLILAHEVGHATRRWRNWLAVSASSSLREEVHADKFALEATGVNSGEWFKAVTNSQGIERGNDRQLYVRAQAMGLPVKV